MQITITAKHDIISETGEIWAEKNEEFVAIPTKINNNTIEYLIESRRWYLPLNFLHKNFTMSDRDKILTLISLVDEYKYKSREYKWHLEFLNMFLKPNIILLNSEKIKLNEIWKKYKQYL